MAQPGTAGSIPRIGYGTWNRNGEAAYNGVRWALEAGYRHVDTAEAYKNEAEVGRAIADGGLRRGEIFLTTKVAPENLGPGQVMPHVKASLDKLRTGQVDLLLVHWPAVKDVYDIEDYMAQFAEVFDAGLAKHIGVSNFTKRHLDSALRILGSRPIATNQVEIHVLMQNRPIVDYTAAKGIPLTAYSPLARGAVSKLPLLRKISATHNATPEQIALAFLLAEGHIVIPSSSSRERIVSNLAANDIALSAEEVRQIRALDSGKRLVNGAWCPVWDV